MRLFSNSSGASSSSQNAFATIQPDFGTSPVADAPNDTLTLTSSDSSVTITGNAVTDTINFQVAGVTGFVTGPASVTASGNIAVYNGTTGKIIKDSLGNIDLSGNLTGLSNVVLVDTTYSNSAISTGSSSLIITANQDLRLIATNSELYLEGQVLTTLTSVSDDVVIDSQSKNIRFRTRGTEQLSIDSGGTFNFLVSLATITSAGVGTGWTQWNVDNLRLDGNTLNVTNANANLLLDGNGTGVVQLNTSTNSQQFPKARPSAVTNPLLTISTSTGQMSWIAASTVFPTWQNVYDTSTTTQSFTLTSANGGLSIKDNATPIAATLFQVTNNAAGTIFFKVNSSGITTSGTMAATGAISGSNFSGSSSGTNTGDVSFAAFGSAPSTSAASLSGQVITLQPADATRPGGVSTTTQTFAGNKTFSGTIAASNYSGTSSGTNTGDQTITLTGDVTGSGTGSFAATIAANAVTNAKLAQMPTLTIKGNNTGGTANALDLTVAQTQTMLQDGWAQLTTGNLKLLTNTLSSTTGDLLLASTGVIVLSPTGSGPVTIGSAAGTADADLIVNKIGLMGSPVSATSVVNFNVTGSARTALNFVQVYNGSAASSGAIVCVTTDQGTSTTFSLGNVLSQTKLNTTTHTANYTQYAFRAELGIDATTILSTVSKYQLYGFRAMLSQQGVGNASTTAGTFYRFGFIQDAMTAIAGTGVTDLIVGAYFADSVHTRADTKFIFDSTISVGNNPSGTTVTFGDTSLSYVAANTDLEMIVDGTLVFMFGSGSVNKSDIVLGTKAGTSTTYAKVGGTINVNTSAVANGTTVETDLMTFSVPANAMATNGDSVYFEMAGTYAATVNTKRVKIKYGATTMFDSTALAINGGKWAAWGRIVRTGAATQTFFGDFTTNNTALTSQSFEGTAAETLSGAVTLKSTGQSSLASNDVNQTNNFVRFDPNQ